MKAPGGGPHARLERAMQDRLGELGLDWVGLAASSGVSTQTIRDIRNGRSKNIRDTTKRALDDGLQWKRGSIDSVLAGGDPTPLAAAEQAIDRDDDIEQSAWILRGAMQAGQEVYTAAVERLTQRLAKSALEQVFARLTDLVLGDEEPQTRRRGA